MGKKKAIAAGHICLDITPAFKSKEEKSIKDLFQTGTADRDGCGQSKSWWIGIQHWNRYETFGRGCRTYGNGRQ